jgi:hypothetical protein
LLTVVCRLSGVTYTAGAAVPNVPFPARWASSMPSADARSLPSLVRYIDEFFETTEGVTSNQFTESTKRLTRVLACMIVVLLNVDSIDLTRNLYGVGPARDNLRQTASQVLELAKANGATNPNAPPPAKRDALLDNLTPSLATLASLLDQPSFKLGWQHSWLAEAWCVADKQCAPGTVEVPTTQVGWVLRIVLWLAGLVLSCNLLAMGAPFWADKLGRLLGWQNAIQRFKDASTDDDSPA